MAPFPELYFEGEPAAPAMNSAQMYDSLQASFAMSLNISNHFPEGMMSTTTQPLQPVILGSSKEDVSHCFMAPQFAFGPVECSPCNLPSNAEGPMDLPVSFYSAHEQYNPWWPPQAIVDDIGIPTLGTSDSIERFPRTPSQYVELGPPLDFLQEIALFQSSQGIIPVGGWEESTSAGCPDTDDTANLCSSEATLFSQVSTSEPDSCYSGVNGHELCGNPFGFCDTEPENGYNRGIWWDVLLTNAGDGDVHKTTAAGISSSEVADSQYHSLPYIIRITIQMDIG
ncbi:uncharacterized protein B0I36DRAFT_394062 [Microdochium trichocladiopsis]|uniref:Uncharacterized protein n=1 Tax=Microdochium trichocladiopsis TaxID=1682393 RepID=A0A9P8XZP2_9PEZI|nr:uncharacterized protein B0I36DRAFT_394062 [Microdochium trichocladiopsis]KAH7021518.1 hypothetical protein B0I36DRAFT_394062 [Microdochium trichocladiopsis]